MTNGRRHGPSVWLVAALSAVMAIGCSSESPSGSSPGSLPATSSAAPGSSVLAPGPVDRASIARAEIARAGGTVHRVIVDGEVVVVHWEKPGAPALAAAEVLRIGPDGSVGDRSHVEQPAVEKTPSGHTMFDGGGDVASVGADVDANKAVVRRLYDEVFNGKDATAIDTLVDPAYTQHNPLVPDGSAALKAFAANGLPVVVNDVVAQGDLVAAWVAYSGVPAVDIFRIEDGKIVEHWDVLGTRSAVELDLDLEHAGVLDTLGIPDLSTVSVGRTFATSFEDPDQLSSFYATPQSALTHREITTDVVHSGTRAQKAWVTGAGGPGLEVDGPNHRGYTTMQLDKLDGGSFASPSIVQLWVWLDVALLKGQWFSFATLTHDASDRWDRVVTVNLDPDGYVNIFHAPLHNQNDLALQRTDVLLPMRSWVRLTMYVDLTEAHGSIAVWQGSTLIAAARIDPRVDVAVQGVRDSLGLPPSQFTDRLVQAHFGLYAPPAVSACTVYNDDLVIAELHPAG